MQNEERERPEIDCFMGEYEFLSNFYPAKLTFDGLNYRSSEAAYQAQKCADQREREAFCALAPNKAKRMGRQVTQREDWEQARLSFMERVVRAKFSQNPQLAAQLLSTGDRPLVEGNTWKDTYWGVDLETGEGENHLGRILMAVREECRRGSLPDEAHMRPIQKFGPVNGVSVIDEDITLMEVDCIVNAANPTLLGGYGVDGAIHRVAGPGLLEECRALGGCETGEAKVTGAYGLRAKHVIHTVGPVYQKDDDGLLERCYWNCMALAAQCDAHTIAFPAISTGKYRFPKERAMEIAVDAVMDWKRAHPAYAIEVFFCCLDLGVYGCCEARLREGYAAHSDEGE